MRGHGAVHRHAEGVLQRAAQKRLAAVEIGGVEPVAAMAGNGHVQVAQERRQPHRARAGIDARQHHHVAAARAAGGVHADEEHVQRLRLRPRGKRGKREQRRAQRRGGAPEDMRHKKNLLCIGAYTTRGRCLFLPVGAFGAQV